MGEFEIFSKKEEQVLSQEGDGSPLSLLLLLPTDAWVGLDELIGVREVTEGGVLTGKPSELSIVLSCRRVV